MAQRGALAVEPRRSRRARSSTFTTTPSISYVEVVAVLLPALAVAVDLLQARQQLDAGVDRQTQRPDVVEGLVVGGEGRPTLDLTQLVGPQGQVPGGGDRGVLLAQRARRGVAGVDVAGQALALLLLVEGAPLGDGHVDLAPDLQDVGHVAGEALGDLGEGGHVGGDVLADPAVAPGGGLDVPALLVADGHGQAVDLQLADAVQRGVVGLAQATLQPGPPRQQLLQLEGVVQRHHPHGVLDRGERGGRSAARRPGWASRAWPARGTRPRGPSAPGPGRRSRHR